MLQQKYDEEHAHQTKVYAKSLERYEKHQTLATQEQLVKQDIREEMQVLCDKPQLKIWYDLIASNHTSRDAQYLGLCRLSCRAFSRVLSVNTSLICLDVSRNELTDEEALYLAKMLRCNHTLESLQLEQNHISSTGLSSLAKALMHNTSLRWLNLDHNPLLQFQVAGNLILHFRGIEDLAEMLGSNDTLTGLTLTNTRLDEDAGRILRDGVEKNEVLLSLELGANAVSLDELEAMATQLEQNQSLALERKHRRNEMRHAMTRASTERRVEFRRFEEKEAHERALKENAAIRKAKYAQEAQALAKEMAAAEAAREAEIRMIEEAERKHKAEVEAKKAKRIKAKKAKAAKNKLF